MDFSELEAIDGLRWAWNSWASTPVEAARMVIPLGILCTPLMPLHDVPLLPYDPLPCNSCHAILNPYCRIDYHARLWICPFCHHRNVFPPSYASITENNLPAELFPTYSTVEYHLNRSSASIAASSTSKFSSHQQMMQGAGIPGFVFVVDTCVPTEDLQHLKNEILHVFSQLPESAVVGLISFGDMVTVHDLSYNYCSRAFVFHGHRELSSTQVLKITFSLSCNRTIKSCLFFFGMVRNHSHA